MLFIVKADFYPYIPQAQMNKLIGSEDTVWQLEAARTIEHFKGYLRARYDTDTLFAAFKSYSDTTVFAIGDRIVWTETAYSETTAYSTDERVVYASNIYKSKAGSVAHAWDANEWDLLAADESKYYCIAASTGNLPTDTTYWTAGDNRNQDLLAKVIDMLLYNIYSRLNAVDIPDIRKERYDGNDSRQTGGAIGWLKMINSGRLEPDFPLNEDNQDDQTGNIVIYGSATESLERNQVF